MTCNDQRSLLLTTGGVGGTVSSAAPGQMDGGGPGGQAPASSEGPAVQKAKKRSKPY